MAAVWQATIVDASGDVQAGASIEVRREDNGALAALYSDVDGDNALENPLTADSDGFARFYVDGGVFRIVATAGDFSRTWRHVPIGLSQPIIGGPMYPQTAAEIAAGVLPVDYRYEELDVRRYGARGDYNPSIETAGLLAQFATDNLPSLQAARDVALAKGKGVIRVVSGEYGDDYWMSNSLVIREATDLYLYIEPGTTLRNTRYTSAGGTVSFSVAAPAGVADPERPCRNVGVFGGGCIRNHRPDHSTLEEWQPNTAYSLGQYVLSMDSAGAPRAYYCRQNGTSGAVAPSVINGNQADGTTSWQDADNDNAIGCSGIGVYIDQIEIPECSGKFVTVQSPKWKDIWITRLRCGRTNDKGIELKGMQGFVWQEDYFGENMIVAWCVIEETGREGIEVEQTSFGVNRNRRAHVLSNTVLRAGTLVSASGIRINRCNDVEIRGNKVLESSGNGYHIRRCRNVYGDIDTEHAGIHGVHMQECEGWSFDTVRVLDPAGDAFRENGDVSGGYIGNLVVQGEIHTNGYNAVARSGPAPFIASHQIQATVAFSGTPPELLRSVKAETTFTGSLEIGRNHSGQVLRKTGGSSSAISGLDDNNIPVGFRCMILAGGSGTTTIVQPGSGATLELFAAAGAPATGTITVAQGGWCELYKSTVGTWRAWGDGLSHA